MCDTRHFGGHGAQRLALAIRIFRITLGIAGIFLSKRILPYTHRALGRHPEGHSAVAHYRASRADLSHGTAPTAACSDQTHKTSETGGGGRSDAGRRLPPRWCVRESARHPATCAAGDSRTARSARGPPAVRSPLGWHRVIDAPPK